MNIFYLDPTPQTCASMHVDKHCVKMILETAQLLSTAHRVLDGVETIGLSQSGRKAKRWVLPDERESILYAATHINHPSAIWCRYSIQNYSWLCSLLDALCKEYTYRYGKIHKCEQIGLVKALGKLPNNIHIKEFTEPTPAMPDQYKVPGNSVKSYHNYYIGEKGRMFSWTNRPTPEFINRI
jgi:hypothetical protein